MGKTPDEWLKQADYDMDTAEFMFNGARYFYTVFMSHLSIEKALKGVYVQKFDKNPPKTHNLLYLIELIDPQIPDDLYDVIFILNRVSISTRYPDNLQRMLEEFDKSKTRDVLERSKEVLKWLKTELYGLLNSYSSV